jgi:ribosome-binding protein aMBF1 (putative translation factor)
VAEGGGKLNVEDIRNECAICGRKEKNPLHVRIGNIGMAPICSKCYELHSDYISLIKIKVEADYWNRLYEERLALEAERIRSNQNE